MGAEPGHWPTTVL